VGPDNKITHARCSKPPYIIQNHQNHILAFDLTIPKIVWSVLNQMCTLLYLKITLSLKIHGKIVKIDKKQNPLRSIAEGGSGLLQCIWIVCTTPEFVCGGGELSIETPCIFHLGSTCSPVEFFF